MEQLKETLLKALEKFEELNEENVRLKEVNGILETERLQKNADEKYDVIRITVFDEERKQEQKLIFENCVRCGETDYFFRVTQVYDHETKAVQTHCVPLEDVRYVQVIRQPAFNEMPDLD